MQSSRRMSDAPSLCNMLPVSAVCSQPLKGDLYDSRNMLWYLY